MLTAEKTRRLSSRTLTLALVLCCATGCATTKLFSWWPNRPIRCELTSEASVEQIVAKLNENVVPSWRSTDVRLTARQTGSIPVTLSAILAVQAPRRLRLIATNSFGNNEFDLGSNDQRFWFWIRRAKPNYIVTVSYDDLPKVADQLQMPFQPEWFMEALGVVQLDPKNFSVEREPKKRRQVRLVSQTQTLQGRPVRKVITVDLCRGVIREHALYDTNGQLLAKAAFSDYRRDPLTNVWLPHVIQLYAPPAGMQLTLRLGQIEVNPVGIASKTWELPTYPNSKIVDLASTPAFQARQAARSSPSTGRTTPWPSKQQTDSQSIQPVAGWRKSDLR